MELLRRVGGQFWHTCGGHEEYLFSVYQKPPRTVSLTEENSADLERVQKCAVRIMLGNK